MDVLLLILRLLLAALLYAFLGALLLMLWRDLKKETSGRVSIRPQGRLVVVESPPDEPDAPEVGRAFPLQPVTSVGRSPANTLVLPDTYASSQHALLSWREGRWWLTDQGSRNGTLLNGEPGEKPTGGAPEDLITIGQTKRKLETGDE